MLEICGRVSHEEYGQEHQTKLKYQILKTKILPTPALQDRINVELIKKSWLKRRLRYYPSGIKIRKSEGRHLKKQVIYEQISERAKSMKKTS